VKLLLDEMLSQDIAVTLRDRGYDAAAISGSKHEQLSDEEVMNLARAQERALVTNNLSDFRPLHHAAVSPGGDGHYGMVFMPGKYRRSKGEIGRVADALEEKLIQYPGLTDLADGETWLST